jgi:hypothetical protein
MASFGWANPSNAYAGLESFGAIAQQTQMANQLATAKRGGGGGGMIAGALPWGAGGGNALSGDPAQAYQAAYNDALAMNRQNYGNIMRGYQKTSRQLRKGQKGLMGELAGIGASRQQEIGDQYAAMQGTQSQELINRGLGNTTVQQAVMRGLTLDEAKAQTDLANKLAAQRAQYRDRFNQQRMALASEQLGFMNSLQAAYPDAGLYASLMEKQAPQMGPTSGLFGGGGSISSGGFRGSGAYWGLPSAGGAFDYGGGGGGGARSTNIDWGGLPTKQSVYGDGYGVGGYGDYSGDVKTPYYGSGIFGADIPSAGYGGNPYGGY